MSDLSNVFVSLNLISIYLFRFGGPVLIVIGTSSCLLNLIVFGKKTLRKNPCSIFFLAFNVNNLFYIHTFFLPVVMSIGYSIEINLIHFVVCRLMMYNALVVDVLSPFYLIGASIDQFLITSTDVRIRQRSSLRFAYVSIVSITLFWFIFHFYALTSTDIVSIAPKFSICYYSSDVIIDLIGYYSLIIKGIIIPFLMATSGFLTIRHIRSLRRVTFVQNSSTNRTSRTNHQATFIRHRDRQFILITLTNIGMYFLCNLMIISDAMYEQMTHHHAKSVDRIEIEYVFRMISVFLSAVSFCTNSYSNLIVSKTFRAEFKMIFQR